MTDWHADPPDDEAPEDRPYATVEAFVREFLAPTFRRELGGARAWCAQWRRHPEAVSRLTGLWLAHEQLAREPTGVSTWWLLHCDPTMRVLLDADAGPFAYCTNGHSDALPALPETS